MSPAPICTSSFLFQCRTFVEPTEIFKAEVEEAQDKVQKAMKVLTSFRATYDDYKQKLKEYFKEEEPKEWEFAAPLVFARMDKFTQRVEIVLVSTVMMQRCFLS